MTAFFRFVNKRVIYRLGIISLAQGTSAKGHGTKIFLQLFFHVFLAEFGKAYIISIEIRHGM